MNSTWKACAAALIITMSHFLSAVFSRMSLHLSLLQLLLSEEKENLIIIFFSSPLDKEVQRELFARSILKEACQTDSPVWAD